MVGVAQLVRAPVCGTGGRGFNSRHSPWEGASPPMRSLKSVSCDMDTKTCSKCNTSRPLSEFGRKRNGYQSFCRPCNREYQRQHYIDNSETYKKRMREVADARKDEVRNWAWDYLAQAGCKDCGIKDPRVLDFDHRNPATKSFTVSRFLNGSHTLKRIQVEVAKCDVRCANCHRLRTAKQLGWYAWRN